MKNYNIGKLVRSLSKKNNLTQEGLGEILGFSESAVSDWENGNTEPNLATVKAFVGLFDITYDTLEAFNG